jgi:hypothetical protein
MSIAAQLGTLNREQTMATNAHEFTELARAIMSQKGNVDLAEKHVRDSGLPLIKTREILKTAVQSGSLTGTWGGELAPFTQVADAFLVSLRNFGVFDQALPFMKQIPLQTQVAVNTVGATAYSVGEGQLKPISKLTLAAASAQLDPQKASAIVIATVSLLKHGGGLAAITLNARSEVFIVANAEQVKYWAFALNGTAGAYPGLTIKGGELLGARVVITDTGTTSATAFDASQIAANGGTIELDASSEATVQLSDTPDSPPTASTNVQSFFQLNLTGLRATRYWGAERLNTRAVAVLTSSPDSP